MKNFAHVNALTPHQALSELDSEGHARLIAGGTDLLTLMKAGIETPEKLVNMNLLRGLNYIRYNPSTGLRIGALTNLSEVANSAVVRSRYGILGQAIGVAATPQLRNMGTVGGNLCQQSRCWYYRGPYTCFLRGGSECYARDGENALHAIFGGGPCFTVHPSDVAPALMALDAQLKIIGAEGERILPLRDFFAPPTEGRRRLHVLGPQELIMEVQIPPPGAANGIYFKAMERKTWSFALTSVAAQVRWLGDKVEDVRIVLGGVSPIPWRLSTTEDQLRGQRLDSESIEVAVSTALNGAQPLAQNSYKIPLAKAMIKRALLEISPTAR